MWALPAQFYRTIYPLMLQPPLTEVKTYIDRNHHLPNVLSAAEVEKNRLDLGGMNEKLLQKMEELALYLIEKDKEIKESKVKTVSRKIN